MKSIDTIRLQLGRGDFEFSRHALRRMVERNISNIEIAEAGNCAEIVEHYPDDKYSPSALLLGFTDRYRALHFQVSLLETPRVRIITVYEPDPVLWISLRIRR